MNEMNQNNAYSRYQTYNNLKGEAAQAQKPQSIDFKMNPISSKLHSGPGCCDQGFKGLPHWHKKAFKKKCTEIHENFDQRLQ